LALVAALPDNLCSRGFFEVDLKHQLVAIKTHKHFMLITSKNQAFNTRRHHYNNARPASEEKARPQNFALYQIAFF
jgi:hypothetical protein